MDVRLHVWFRSRLTLRQSSHTAIVIAYCQWPTQQGWRCDSHRIMSVSSQVYVQFCVRGLCSLETLQLDSAHRRHQRLSHHLDIVVLPKLSGGRGFLFENTLKNRRGAA